MLCEVKKMNQSNQIEENAILRLNSSNVIIISETYIFLLNDNTIMGDKNLKFPAIKVNKKDGDDDNYKLLGKDYVSIQQLLQILKEAVSTDFFALLIFHE